MKNISIPKWTSYGILLIAAFLFVFLFSSTTSPLYAHHPFWFHDDSGIFQELGICLAQGGTPYLDLFDHKGPILWFIQALGFKISPYIGHVVLQTIALFCTLLLWYKSVNILVERQIFAIIIVLTGLLFLMAFYERGNLCEEWSLPFISLPIYLYLQNRKASSSNQICFSHKSTVVLGLCVGVLAMIRLNNTAPLIGFTLWHFIICIKNRDYKRLWIDIAIICGGMAIVFVLCSAFYLIRAGWTGVYEMIYGTFIYNFLYINDTSNLPLITYLNNYLAPIVFLIITIVCLLYRKKTIVDISIPLAISYIVTILAIGRFAFFHYMMIFIPLFIVSSSLIVMCSIRWLYIIWAGLLVYAGRTGYDAADHLAFRLMGKKADTEINDGFHRFINTIPEEERHSIYNAGLNSMGAGLFADESLYQCNRFIYEHFDISPHLQKYVKTHGIKELQPAWILTQGQQPVAVNDYMSTHYVLADSIPGGQFDPIWCWKKNNEHVVCP